MNKHEVYVTVFDQKQVVHPVTATTSQAFFDVGCGIAVVEPCSCAQLGDVFVEKVVYELLLQISIGGFLYQFGELRPKSLRTKNSHQSNDNSRVVSSKPSILGR